MQKIIIISILTGFITGCQFPQQKSEFSTKSQPDSLIQSTDKYDIKAYYPKFEQDATNKVVTGEINKVISDFKSVCEKTPVSDDWNNELYLKTDVSVAKDKYISVVLSIYQYAGGAHGNKTCSSMVINVQSNERYYLTDFFNGNVIETIQKPVRDKLNATLSTSEFVDVGTETLADFSVFSLTDSHITFWFAPYQVATYAEGTQKVSLSIADLPNFKWPE